MQFANVHDISWGTKGDNVVSLGTVATGKSGEVVAVVPDEKDMNELYEDALHVLQTKKPKEEKSVDQGQATEDYYRNFRTKFVDFFLVPTAC
jgi:chitin synthase